MSNTLATLDPALLEQVVVGGDLERLPPAARLEWYRQRCEAAGLDPRTQPFMYLKLNGKLVLYASKSCTDQLIANRNLSIEIVDRRTDGDLYEVQARVRRADSSTVDDVGVVPIAGLKGDNAANARLKCVTKAKRRAVLSACGLGMLDETEVETIRDARRVTIEEVHAALPPRSFREGDPSTEQPPDFAQPKQPKQRGWRERIADCATGDALDDMEVRVDAAMNEGKLTAAQIEELRDLLHKRRLELEQAEVAG